MSNTKNNPVDPFADINLDRFKAEQGKKKSSLKKPQLDKEAIKAVAEENDFQSRKAAPKKQKVKYLQQSWRLDFMNRSKRDNNCAT